MVYMCIIRNKLFFRFLWAKFPENNEILGSYNKIGSPCFFDTPHSIVSLKVPVNYLKSARFTKGAIFSGLTGLIQLLFIGNVGNARKVLSSRTVVKYLRIKHTS